MGTEYNQTVAKLVYITLGDSLQRLSKQHQPIDGQHICTVILDGTKRFSQEVCSYRKQLIERVKELWGLGVFHWDECRNIVLSHVPVRHPSMTFMARPKGKHKAARRAKKKDARQNDRNNNNTNTNYHTQAQARSRDAGPATANPNQVEVAGHDHYVPPFHSSTSNDRAVGDEDLMLLDATPMRTTNSDSQNTTLVEESAESGTERYGVDIFLAASKRDMRDHLRNQQKINVPSMGP